MKRFMTSIVILGLLALSGVTISEVRAGVRLRQVPNAPAASPRRARPGPSFTRC